MRRFALLLELLLLAVQLVLPVQELTEPMRQAAEQRRNDPDSPQRGAQQTGSSRFDWFHNTP
tara:strand:- start:64791 stop:64976 length:186 start_codon:yes stop_codon:yes gene_type:complete